MNYTSRRNPTNKTVKTFKDYLVPIIIVFVVALLVLNNIFSSSDDKKNTTNINQSLEVTLSEPTTEAYVILDWWNKTKVETKSTMYSTEKLQVVNGSLNIKWQNADLVLNKLWELRYNEDGNYTLYSSDLWVNWKSALNVEMRYAKISSTDKSVFSLSQNEVASTIYVLDWNVTVQNLVWKSATLQKGDKLVIMRNNSNDETSDLSLSKEQIDDYIKSDDWFIKNNWSFYLSQTDSLSWSGDLTLSGNTLSWSLTSSWEVYSLAIPLEGPVLDFLV